MHRDTTMKHGGHHLHDTMLTLRHEISEHFHSRHFWVGVVVTLLIVGFVTAVFMLARNAPIIYPQVPYTPYGV